MTDRYTYEVIAGERGHGFVHLLDNGERMKHMVDYGYAFDGWDWTVSPLWWWPWSRALHVAVEKAERWCHRQNIRERDAQDAAQAANALAELYRSLP